ncbi:MAG TPA: hypothetical protein VIJ75_07985 [Hanamia sp.]
MKKNYANIIGNRCFLVVVILVISTINLKAQRLLPHMWVAESEGIKRQDWFKEGTPATKSDSKYNLLRNSLNFDFTHSIICPVKNLRDFIDGIKDPNLNILRFYFAEYDNNSGNVVPSAIANDMTLIMVPGSAPDPNPKNLPGTDGKDYYNISPNGDITLITDKTIVEGWINNFNANLMQELDKTIKDAPENESNGVPSDTKSCFYRLSDFKEFLDSEIVHQDSIGVSITGIQINFCSNDSNGITCNGKSHFYKDRLILQFEYTHKKGLNNYDVFYIEDNPDDFKHRQKQTPICSTLARHVLTSDNALLCPDNCP